MRKLYGKRFVTRDDAEPIVCFAEDGSLVASIDFGLARLRELPFRGIASAGMVYDQQPWIDYFRKLDDNTLVAMIDMKGERALAFSCCAADRRMAYRRRGTDVHCRRKAHWSSARTRPQGGPGAQDPAVGNCDEANKQLPAGSECCQAPPSGFEPETCGLRVPRQGSPPSLSRSGTCGYVQARSIRVRWISSVSRR
jgi:hypothetical protein